MSQLLSVIKFQCSNQPFFSLPATTEMPQWGSRYNRAASIFSAWFTWASVYPIPRGPPQPTKWACRCPTIFCTLVTGSLPAPASRPLLYHSQLSTLTLDSGLPWTLWSVPLVWLELFPQTVALKWPFWSSTLDSHRKYPTLLTALTRDSFTVSILQIYKGVLKIRFL